MYITSQIYTRFAPVKLFNDLNACRKAIRTRIMYLTFTFGARLYIPCPKTLFSAPTATSKINWSHESFRIASVFQRSREVGTFAERPTAQLTIYLTYGASDLMVPFNDLGNTCITTHKWCHKLDTSMDHCVILSWVYTEHPIQLAQSYREALSLLNRTDVFGLWL